MKILSPLRSISTALLLTTPWAPLLAHNFDVLVFTKESGATHSSTAAGITMLNDLGLAHDFGVTQTSDATTFVNELPNHQVVLFLNTSGDVLNASQEGAFQAWYQGGKAFVGIHGAADTETTWNWYRDLVGARAASETSLQAGTVEFLDQAHPITNVIDAATSRRVASWTVNEQWYNFTANPRGDVHVLAQVDERVTTANSDEPADTGITGGAHGDDHPIIWCRDFDGGRSVYLGPGHQASTFSDTMYRGLVTNAIEWAAGQLGGDSGATIEANFEKVDLETNLSNPMSLDVAADGKIYLVERKGAVKVHDQDTGVTTTIGTLSEYSGGEYGVMGIALAPDFETSRHLYILWSPSTGTKTRVSRYTLNTAGNLNLGSEVVILDYLTNRPTQTGAAGHHQGGCMRFDSDGNLFIAVGDDTQASSYSPRNNNIGRDARKASPNTNDLRGKILRITPNVGGGPISHPNYTIPGGNLFAAGTANAREEIYVMGCRNCFRMAVDPVNGWVYYGDVGPDGQNNGSGNFQGARGHDEFNQVKSAGWFGWPYFLGDNKSYRDGSGNPWTIPNLRSDLTNYFNGTSFGNSGALAGDSALLSNPQPAWIWYPYGAAPPRFSELGTAGNRCAMAGAVYEHTSGRNFPAYYDGSVFIMEWARNRIYDVHINPDGTILEITRFAPQLSFNRPMDMVFGDDGVMYMIEWGTQFGTANSSGSKLVKVQYTAGSATPIAVASSDVNSGTLPLTVNFSSAGSLDPDSTEITFEWDFDGDQVVDSTEPNPVHTYTTAGTYAVQLTVTDNDLLFARANLTIAAGNSVPVITFSQPETFSFFDWGDVVSYEFSVTDSEDGSSAAGQITSGDVLFEASLGHDDHQHNEIQLTTLQGDVIVPRDSSHPFDLNIGFVFDAFYTDQGAPGVDPLQGSTKTVLQPKVTMAQSYDGHSGLQKALTQDAVGGGQDVVDIDNGDFLFFENLNLGGITHLRLRASTAGNGGTVKVYQDAPSGTAIATVTVGATGGEDVYRDFEAALSGQLSGNHDLYFVFEGAIADFMRLNWINFRGVGTTLIPNLPLVDKVEVSGPDIIKVTFDQEMDWATLSNPANYSLTGGASIASVTPLADQSGVFLQLSGATDNSYYALTMNGIEDLAGDTMEANSTAVVYYQELVPANFVIGLNAGGADFLDSEGNLYLADATPLPGSDNAATVLVDFGGAESSDASHFAVGDANVDLFATINVIGAQNFTNTALNSVGISGVTLSNSGGDGNFNTNKGFYDDVPILDGYIYEGAAQGTGADSALTIAGLDGIATGDTITLTIWGVGDTANSDATFQVVYNGSTVGTQNTNYDGNSEPGTRVQFSFNKVSGANAITVNWGKKGSGSSTTGLNAFALTVGTPSTSYITELATEVFSTTDAISGTTDDTLYRSERNNNGDFGYSIPLSNGTYDVLFRFAETFYTTDGLRTMNARIEGGTNLFSPALDIHAVAGHDIAQDYTFENVTVADGMLDIEFVSTGVDRPKVSAIGVFQASVGGGLPDPSFANYLTNNPESRYSIYSDVDGDSVPTLLEYAFGGNDEVNDLSILPDFAPTVPTDPDVIFSRPVGLPDVTYSAMASQDLNTWIPVTPTIVVTPLAGGMEEVRFQGLGAAAATAGLPADDRCFFRIDVSLTSP